MSFWDTVKYFKLEEFSSSDEPGSGKNIHPILVKMLDELREKVGGPITISSGYRTRALNDKLVKNKSGAVQDSAHCKGYACDLYCPDSLYRFKLVSKALEIGFLRCGIGSTFIHVDMDPDKPQQVMWLY